MEKKCCLLINRVHICFRSACDDREVTVWLAARPPGWGVPVPAAISESQPGCEECYVFRRAVQFYGVSGHFHRWCEDGRGGLPGAGGGGQDRARMGWSLRYTLQLKPAKPWKIPCKPLFDIWNTVHFQHHYSNHYTSTSGMPLVADPGVARTLFMLLDSEHKGLIDLDEYLGPPSRQCQSTASTVVIYSDILHILQTSIN